MNYAGGLTSGNVVIVTIGSGVVEIVGVAVGITVISHSVPYRHSTSGLESAILNNGGRLTSSNVGHGRKCHHQFGHGRKCGSSRWNFGDISFRSI